MQIFLELRSGPNAGTRIPLSPGQSLRIGRTTKAEQAFPADPSMSSIHCAFECDDRGCRVRDLNSSNGTFLNDARVKEAALANGDEIRAGATTFVIRIVPDEPLAAPLPKPMPPAPVPLKYGELPSFPAAAPVSSFPAPPQQASPGPAAPAPRQPRLQDILAKDFQPLYVLLDASREPSVLKVILESKEEYQSLYEGPQGAQLAHFAPYLIRVPQKSALIDTLVQQAWSKSWGVFLTCDAPLKDLRTHFRHFLNVKLPDGQQVYFRYYDPRVLRLFLPTCLPEEANQFFGPVKHFLIETEDPATALHFTRGPKGADKKDLHLAPA